MSNPKVKYALIIAVAVIWGLVIYTFITGNEEQVYVFPNHATTVQPSAEFSPDTFELLLDYGKIYNTGVLSYASSSRPVPATKSTVAKTVKPASVKPKVKWPIIRFVGYIENHNSGEKISIYNIAGQEKLMRVGEAFGEVRLMELGGDSACFQIYEERRCIEVK